MGRLPACVEAHSAATFCSACSSRGASPQTVGGDRAARSRAGCRALPSPDHDGRQCGRTDRSTWTVVGFSVSAAAFETREVQQVADDGSSRWVSSCTISRYRSRVGVVELQRGHRERLDVAAHRRERRHQLVGDVRQQLPPGLVRRFERATPGSSSSSAIRLNDRATAATSSPPARSRGRRCVPRPTRAPPPRACGAACASAGRRAARLRPHRSRAMSGRPRSASAPAPRDR